MLALFVTLALAATPQEKPKLVVLDLTPAGGVDPTVAAAMTEAVTAELASRGIFQVVSSGEVRTLIGQERQRQLLGCGDDASSCVAELAGALGAPFVMTGTLARLGEVWQLTLQTVDTLRARPLSRSVRLANDLGALRAMIPFLAAEATATPLPTPASRVLPITFIAVGGAGLLAGGILSLDSLLRDQLLSEELASGDRPGRLQTFASYEQARAFIGTERTIALVSAAGGAALLGVGLVLLLRADAPPPPVTLVPTARGLALTGAF